MAEATPPLRKKAGTGALIVRIALFAALALVIVFAVGWYTLKRDFDRGTALYEAGKYQETVDLLEPLSQNPLARLKLRGPALRTIGLCKAELATQIAMKERSVEGYRKALDLLDQAKRLAGPTPEIELGIKEYTEYLQKLEEPAAPLALPPPPLPRAAE